MLYFFLLIQSETNVLQLPFYIEFDVVKLVISWF